MQVPRSVFALLICALFALSAYAAFPRNSATSPLVCTAAYSYLVGTIPGTPQEYYANDCSQTCVFGYCSSTNQNAGGATGTNFSSVINKAIGIGSAYISLAKGIFVIDGSSHINPQANTVIQGSGLRNTVIQKSSGADTNMINNLATVFSGFTIKDITFDDTNSASQILVLYAQGISNLTLDHIEVLGGTNQNARINIFGRSPNAIQNIAITNSFFSNIQSIQINGAAVLGNRIYVNHVLIRGNTFSGCQGLCVGNVAINWIIAENSFIGIAGTGAAIDIANSPYATIEHNTFSGMKTTSIYSEEGELLSIIGNVINGTTSTNGGIQLSNGAGFAPNKQGSSIIEGNVISNILGATNANGAIELDGTSRVQIIGNIIQNVSGTGIMLNNNAGQVSSNDTISNNQIFNFGTTQVNSRGIWERHGGINDAMNNNVIDGNGNAGAVTGIYTSDTSDYTQIEENQIYGVSVALSYVGTHNDLT